MREKLGKVVFSQIRSPVLNGYSPLLRNPTFIARYLSDNANGFGKMGSSFKNAAKDLDSAGDKIAQVEEDFHKLKKEVEDLGINDLKATITELKDDVKDAHSESHQAQQTVAVLQSDFTQIKEESDEKINSLKEEYEALHEEEKKKFESFRVAVKGGGLIAVTYGLYKEITDERHKAFREDFVTFIKGCWQKIMGGESVPPAAIDSKPNVTVPVDELIDNINSEILRLQYKYSQSFSGMWIFSPVSRGYSHSLKIKILLDLKRELSPLVGKKITVEELFKLIDQKLSLPSFKDAYSSGEKEDADFIEQPFFESKVRSAM